MILFIYLSAYYVFIRTIACQNSLVLLWLHFNHQTLSMDVPIELTVLAIDHELVVAHLGNRVCLRDLRDIVFIVREDNRSNLDSEVSC